MSRLSNVPFVLAALALVACGDAAQPVTPSTADATGASTSTAAADVVGQGIPDFAIVQFGIDEHGSPFPPPSGHDASGHARDKVYPRNVVLRAGGSITFQIDLVHQVAVYRAGTQPSDISLANLETVDLTPGPIIPNFRINDPNGRLAESQPQTILGDQIWTTPPGTFATPGRYLVICTTVPHFVEANMYAWVTVK